MKVTKYFATFLGYFEVCQFIRKYRLVSFWATVVKFG